MASVKASDPMDHAEDGVSAAEQAEAVAEADLLIALVSPVETDKLARACGAAFEALAETMPEIRCAVAYPGALANSDEAASERAHLIGYELAADDSPLAPWLARPSAIEAVRRIAAERNARACILLAPDLAAMNAETLRLLAGPVLDNSCDLCLPIYPAGKYEGLINSGILAPMTRALYGWRVRFPLSPEFCASTAMLERLAAPERGAQSSIVWPATVAARTNGRMSQVCVDIRHEVQRDAVDLAGVLSQLTGSLYAEMERNAAVWQHIHGSQPVPASGQPVATEDGEAVDVRPLIDSFVLGSRNLQEVWSLVLPPVTLLGLKRLAQMAPETFRIPDELWVHIVYDFALAFRLRTISRAHLLGALLPLYLGWVASYVTEVSACDAASAQARQETLARAFEEAKPYLLSRWRWPDRFNP